MTAARDYDDLHHLVHPLSPHRAQRLRALAASDPELAPAAEPERQGTPRRQLSITGIWESGRDDLAERPEEIIRGRLKPPASRSCSTPAAAAIDRSGHHHARCATLAMCRTWGTVTFNGLTDPLV